MCPAGLSLEGGGIPQVPQSLGQLGCVGSSPPTAVYIGLAWGWDGVWCGACVTCMLRAGLGLLQDVVSLGVPAVGSFGYRAGVGVEEFIYLGEDRLLVSNLLGAV